MSDVLLLQAPDQAPVRVGDLVLVDGRLARLAAVVLSVVMCDNSELEMVAPHEARRVAPVRAAA